MPVVVGVVVAGAVGVGYLEAVAFAVRVAFDGVSAEAVVEACVPVMAVACVVVALVPDAVAETVALAAAPVVVVVAVALQPYQSDTDSIAD